MTLRIRNELVLVCLIGLTLPILGYLPVSPVLGVALGIPALLTLPGYSLIALLFPKKGQLTGIERSVLSLVFSIIVVTLTGLLFKYLPWGIRPLPVFSTVAVQVIACSLAGFYRRRTLDEGERFQISIDWHFLTREKTRLDRSLSILLAGSIVIALGAMGYGIVRPGASPGYTEFAVTSPDGRTITLPRVTKVGDAVPLLLEIVNREGRKIRYHIEARLDGRLQQKLGPIEVAPEKSWKQEISVAPATPGTDEKLELLLYKQDQGTPDISLHLFFDVRATEEYFSHFYLLFFPRHPKDRNVEGAERTAVVGVQNREQEPHLYRIEAWLQVTPPHGIDPEAYNYDYYAGWTDGWWWKTVGEIGPVSVAPNGTWEPEVPFEMLEGGKNVWIRFLLFDENQKDPIGQLPVIIPLIYVEEF